MAQYIISYYTDDSTFSDHSLNILIRAANITSNPPRYYKTRNYKNYSKEGFENKMKYDNRYIPALTSNDPNYISNLSQAIIKDALDSVAPIIKIQVKKR